MEEEKGLVKLHSDGVCCMAAAWNVVGQKRDHA